MEKLKLIFANLILEYEQALEKVFFFSPKLHLHSGVIVKLS